MQQPVSFHHKNTRASEEHQLANQSKIEGKKEQEFKEEKFGTKRGVYN